jgi:hypothetical protein
MYKGIISKLDFKTAIYLIGITKNSIIRIYNQEQQFVFHYKNINNDLTIKSISKKDIYDFSKIHFKTLLNN